MKTARYNVVYNRKNKLLSNGTALVQVEVYMRGKNKYFSTNIYLSPDQWDNKHRRIKNHPNALRLNKQVGDFVSQLANVELERINNGKSFTLEHLTDFVDGKITNSFTQFIQTEIEQSKVAPSTKTTHKTTLRVFKEFRKDVLFTDLNFELLSDFERYLYAKDLGVNTVNKYFRHLRTFVNLAIDKDLLELNKYPFRKYKFKSVATTREYLTPEDLIKLEQLILPDDKKHLQKVLDMFMFSCYTGLRFSDASEVRRINIATEDGKQWLIMRMKKTKEDIKLPLTLLFNGKPIEILDRYSDKDNKTPIFGELTNQYVNRCLKVIANLADINRVVTYHVARHTLGTFMCYKGVSITTIQKLLGHKKLQTTQIYSKVMNVTVANELETISF